MSKANQPPIILIGGGGHAAVLADILLGQHRDILAVISPTETDGRSIFAGIERLNSDDKIKQFDPSQVRLVNGIGMMPRSKLKQQINEAYSALGYIFETVIATDAIVSCYATLQQGVQIFAGSIVQSGSVIGAHSIINTGVVIEHDCRIGTYNHIAPRAVLCGQVATGTGVYVGAGATVIQSLSLAKDTIVAAGATVVNSLTEKQIVYSAKTVTKLI